MIVLIVATVFCVVIIRIVSRRNKYRFQNRKTNLKINNVNTAKQENNDNNQSDEQQTKSTDMKEDEMNQDPDTNNPEG